MFFLGVIICQNITVIRLLWSRFESCIWLASSMLSLNLNFSCVKGLAIDSAYSSPRLSKGMFYIGGFINTFWAPAVLSSPSERPPLSKLRDCFLTFFLKWGNHKFFMLNACVRYTKPFLDIQVGWWYCGMVGGTMVHYRGTGDLLHSIPWHQWCSISLWHQPWHIYMLWSMIIYDTSDLYSNGTIISIVTCCQ